MNSRPVRSERSLRRLLPGLVVAMTLVVVACSSEERKEIRLTPTSTVEAGVRVIVDNCPGPDAVTLSVRDEPLWRIETLPVVDDGVGDVPQASDDETSSITPNLGGDPGLVEFLVGQTPDGWTEIQALEQTLSDGIRYTIATEPDQQQIDFSLPDLAPGLVFNGTGRAQFSPNLISVECSEPADVGLFARNMMVLVALWLTAAALVMVSLILLLFVITRRFSRIRSIERRTGETAGAPVQRPRVRSSR